MDPFLNNAEQILAAAHGCARARREPGDEWTILLGPGGRIEMVAGSGWALEALRRERGAEMAYRVGSGAGRVAVEGRTRGRACRLESETPAGVARRLLGGPARYTLLRPALTSPTG